MPNFSLFFLGLYMVLALAVIVMAGTAAKLRYVLKPLTLPCLAAAYGLSCLRYAFKPEIMVFLALFAGFLGDLFFLWQNKKRLFFSGLFCFLLGHLFYGFYFAGTLEGFSLSGIRFAAALLIYAAVALSIMRIIRRRSPALKLAMGGYMLVIAALNFILLQRSWNFSGAAFWMPYAGSFFFIISDTLIAVRNFYRRKKWQSPVISLTYYAAQLLLILGVLMAQSL